MTVHVATPPPEDLVDAASGAEHDARAVYGRQLARLDQLAEEGMRISHAIARLATETRPGETAPTAEGLQALAMAHGRVARAVRLTLALQTKAVEALRLLDRQDALVASSLQKRANAARPHLTDERKAQVQRIVGRIADAQYDNEATVERLVEEAAERLDREDIYGDVLLRPASDLIAQVCRELGLNPDWLRLAEEAWARAEIDSGAPGAPLKPWMAQPPPDPEPAACPASHRPAAPSAAHPAPGSDEAGPRTGSGGDPGFFLEPWPLDDNKPGFPHSRE